MRLKIESLSKTYPGANRPAVAGLNLEIPDRELLVLTGPSGCGKTTTLRLIAGLEQPDCGQVFADARSWDGIAPQDRDVALVFQSGALFPHLTVFDNLAIGLRLRKVPPADIADRVKETAAWLEIEALLQRHPEELSGGENQRVALGRAFIRRPKLLLLDEPLGSLDTPLRVQLRAEIRRLHRQLGTTTIHVTHDQDEALALGDRVAVMRAGELQQVGTPREIRQASASQFVADFFRTGSSVPTP